MSGKVPPSSKSREEAAKRLFKEFSGHTGESFHISVPDTPTHAIVVGYCDAIEYETVRDGKVEHYRHKFAKNSRPLLGSSSDGKQLLVLGGAYDFTERGIVDRKVSKSRR